MQYTRQSAQLFFDFLKKIVYSHERYYLATGEMKMKLLVFSDSHRANITDMLALIDEEKPDAVAHLGDLVCDVEDIRFVYPELPVYSVRGNNDWGDDETPNSLVVCAEQVRLFLTHGHLFGVRRNTKRLTQEAQQAGCQVARRCMRRTAFWWRIRAASACRILHSRRRICGSRLQETACSRS